MEQVEKIAESLSLDPSDWSEYRALAHRAVDDMVDHLSSLRSQPVWQQMPESVSRGLSSEPLPCEPQGSESVYREFIEQVLPYPNGNLHPRFYGWVQGTGIPLANVADYLASSMNPHMAGGRQAPTLVERKVVEWLAEIVGFPVGASGVLESGGTMANILGLAIGLRQRAGFNVRTEGLQGAQERLTIYSSSETHGWIQKGVELLGIGTTWLRSIPVGQDFRIDMDQLRARVQSDRKLGYRPVCVVGTAGTVNTGAIDPLSEMADFCAEEGLWFHVDGAFGALASLSPLLRPRLAGMERADSLALDLHKWMYLPFEIACVLVREGSANVESFSHSPTYLQTQTRGVTAGGFEFADRGIDLTRGFKALKAWMCLKAYGTDTFGRMIEQNVEQTERLVQLIHARPWLEMLAPCEMNVACFRYRVDGKAEEALGRLNLELLLRLQESGRAVLSSTVVDGKFALRFCNVNQRSTMEDIGELVEALTEIGGQVALELDV